MSQVKAVCVCRQKKKKEHHLGSGNKKTRNEMKDLWAIWTFVIVLSCIQGKEKKTIDSCVTFVQPLVEFTTSTLLPVSATKKHLE